MIRDISIKLLLVFSFLVSGLIPTMIVSLIGFSTARAELKEQAFRQLESVRNIKKEQIKNFFNERSTNIAVFARNPHIKEAYKELEKAFYHAGGSAGQQFRGHLEEEYDAPRSYREIHDKYFPYFKHLIREYGYYDLFLVDPRSGDTVFTVRKESDFGISIGRVSSSLRDVWIKARDEGRIALSDTKPYPPSHNAPAQFLAAPIRENGTIAGIVAVQISIDSIDHIMKERSGMWKTGETYLVGPDKKMRSDSYMDNTHHSVYASFNGTVEKNGVDTVSSRAALNGETGTRIIVNYRGQEVLSAYTPIQIENVKWAMIAEIDKKEIEQQIADALNVKIIFLFIVSTAILVLLSLIISVFISRGVRKTIQQLENMIKDVLKGNLRARGDTDSVGVDFKGVVHGANQLIDAFAGQWEEKRKLEEHIRYNQRLKAIGTLAGGIAHDFNNILTSMFAYSHIVMSDLPDGSPAKENMREIVIALRRASGIVDQILTFGRQVKTEKRVVEINHMISGTLKLVNATLPKSITVQCGMPDEKLYIKAAPSQVNQVLMNLCTNASHAMQDTGGLLNISLTKITADDARQADLSAGEYCKLIVTDTGHGIDPEIRERIFEPFFTTKPVGQGSGMGLSMVHGIVMNYGGRIDVESTPGKGSRFDIYLPLVEPGLAGEKVTHNIEPVAHEGKHILFIDDETQICRSESHILETAGYIVTAISDSREVEKVFLEDSDRFDLVVTDLHMPHLNGIEVARMIFLHRPDLPVILTTGYSHYDQILDKNNMKQTNILALLKKPYEKDRLFEVISQTIDSSRTGAC